MLWGIVLIIVGLAVGPGGYSIFKSAETAPNEHGRKEPGP